MGKPLDKQKLLDRIAMSGCSLIDWPTELWRTTPLPIICHCGSHFSMTSAQIVSCTARDRPIQCPGHRKYWTNVRIDDWLIANNRTFSRLTDVTNISQPSTTPIEWTCLVDGHVWSARVDNIVGKGSGCPKCSGTLPLTVEQVTDRTLTRSKAVCLVIHPGSAVEGKRATFECCKCSGQWTALLHNVLSHGYGCPKCNANLSTPCQSADGEHFHSMLERSFWEGTIKLRDNGIRMERQAQYLHTRRFSCDFYFPSLMLLVEISGKTMLSRPEYQQTIELKHRMAEAGHRGLVVLSDSVQIHTFIQNLENCFI